MSQKMRIIFLVTVAAAAFVGYWIGNSVAKNQCEQLVEIQSMIKKPKLKSGLSIVPDKDAADNKKYNCSKGSHLVTITDADYPSKSHVYIACYPDGKDTDE